MSADHTGKPAGELARAPSPPSASSEHWQHRAPVAIDPIQYQAWCDEKLAGMMSEPAGIQQRAADGITGPATALPHGDAIQASFGHHDVSGVQAHVGGPATDAASAMGAHAYATGNHVAFAAQPDLHLAAHEAAHVVQQRGGVQFKAGVGEVGDAYEQHADAVADAVVRGESAAPLLDRMAGHGSATPAVQRFGSGEHREIGTAATGGTLDPATGETKGANVVRLADDYWLPYGEMIALAGDHFESIDQMRGFARVTGGGESSRAEIEYARYWKLGVTSAKFDDAAKKAQEARYYKLALDNRRHFVNPAIGDAAKPMAERVASAPDPANDPIFHVLGQEFHAPPKLDSAIHGYRYYHLRALATAAKAGAEGRGVEDAYAEEAFGCHFLTDSFSAGHIRTERASVKEYWNKKHPMFNHNLKGLMAEEIAKIVAATMTVGGAQVREDFVYDPVTTRWPIGDGAKQTVAKTLDAYGKLTLGDVFSGALHDYDNKHGVKATSGGADVTLYGDGHLAEGDTKPAVVIAVSAGAGEITHAHRLGKQGVAPRDVVLSLLGPDKLFTPERLVPRAKPDAEQGPDQAKTQWQFGSLDTLFANAQFVDALFLFAKEQANVIREGTASFDEGKKKAVEDGFIAPLLSNPPAMLRRIIDWTPTLTDSAGGRNTDDHSNDYWKEAKKTPGGLESLTYPQRERLIDHILQGATVGDDEDAILDILRTAGKRTAGKLIRHFGWERLHDNLDDGFGEEFAEEFPASMY